MSKAGKKLIAAAHEMVAVARGEAEPARVTTFVRWQPIETAPKDGSDVLLYRTSNGFSDKPPVVAGWFEDGWYVYDNPDVLVSGKPTHWMPLPPAPIHPETGED